MGAECAYMIARGAARADERYCVHTVMCMVRRVLRKLHNEKTEDDNGNRQVV